MFHSMTPKGMLAALAAGLLLGLALVAKFAQADTWCARPGPSGEAMYCTDEPDSAPASILERMVPYSGSLKDYRKLTVQQRQPGLHAWPLRFGRERWRRLDGNTWVHDMPDGTRSTWRRYGDGTLRYDGPRGGMRWFFWRWEE